MSRPPTFIPPPCARPRTLHTGRGDFAVLDAVPRTRPRGTVLLLPGFTGSKEDFIALLQPLADAGYRAVTVDGRGQYETDGTDRQETYEQGELAQDVLAQTAALGLGDGAVDLLGHSLGGQIARAAVLLDPAPFRSLALMSSGPAEVIEAQQVKLKILGDALATMSMDDVWAAMRALDPCGRGGDGRRGHAAALAAPPPRAADRHRLYSWPPNRTGWPSSPPRDCRSM